MAMTAMEMDTRPASAWACTKAARSIAEPNARTIRRPFCQTKVVLDHMSERAYDSDAGEWADNYPTLDATAKADLERAMRPLMAWARKHCQPEFFTIKDVTPHIVTEEDVTRSRKS